MRTNDSVLYLAGSMHVLRESDALVPIASLEHAFARSQRVAFEVNPEPDNQAAVDRYMGQRGFYPPGEGSLRKAVGEMTYARLQRILVGDGVPGAAIERMKPWLASVLINNVFDERRGFIFDYGIDRRYYNLAGEKGKARLFLETPYQHVNVIAGTPQGEWAAYIGPQLEDRGKSILRALQIYMGGDVQALSQSVAWGAAHQPGIHRGLLVNRNLRWLPAIESYLRQTETTMVVVGAAHMVRATGLVTLLKKRGYELVQLPGDPPALTSFTLTYQEAEGEPVTVPLDVITTPAPPRPAVVVPAGSTVTFSVTTTGDGPFFYQWYKGGVEIGNAPSLQLLNVTAKDDGTYGLILTSDFGSVALAGRQLSVAQ